MENGRTREQFLARLFASTTFYPIVLADVRRHTLIGAVVTINGPRELIRLN